MYFRGGLWIPSLSAYIAGAGDGWHSRRMDNFALCNIGHLRQKKTLKLYRKLFLTRQRGTDPGIQDREQFHVVVGAYHSNIKHQHHEKD
jgi:hypothetical protein